MKTVGIGVSVPRKESRQKVTGTARYNTDFFSPGLLYAWMITSLYAHAKIKAVHTAAAEKMPGVRAVITGEAYTQLYGEVMEDRPFLAKGKVRYFGEPVAVVIATSMEKAKAAAGAVRVDYEPLPVVNSIDEALADGAPLVHEQLAYYKRVKPDEIFPQPGTNIAQHIKVRKGDIDRGWAQSDLVVESDFVLPQSNHIAMEPRNARAEIKPDGKVIIHTSSQAPFDVRKMISQYFKLDQSKVIVHIPLVGGAFGGKTTAQLEVIAYLASLAVNGRPVKLVESREQDMFSSPCHVGLKAHVKLGATRDGFIQAAEFKYYADIGAYTDTGPNMTRGMAADGTGPYNIENVHCDAYSVYTNHTYVTAFRGFGRLTYVLAMERTLDKLAYALGMDPLQLRLKNAIKPGNTTPTQARLNDSNLGDLSKCLHKLHDLMSWDEGVRVETGPHKVRAKGLSCLWKTSSSPPNAGSGALITMNKDGTLNLSVGSAEIGPGTKTSLTQMLAERLRMDVDKIHMVMDVNTEVSPKHWKTVASMTSYMVGNAVLDAAEDLVRQLLDAAAVVLRCPPEVLDIGQGKVYLKEDPGISVKFQEIAHGYQYPDGKSVGGQILGRGNFIMTHLIPMEKETGKGKLGPAWAVGAQAVEVEFDTRDCSYEIVKAASVIDAGKVINPKMARGVVMGGMCMGLGYGSREYSAYGTDGIRENPQLRTYHLMRLGENPQYMVDFVESPDLTGPYGVRGIGEHGIIGIPAALANALSAAAQVELNHTPLTPEAIWRLKQDK